MLKPSDKARDWANRILAASKDKESSSYFIDKYLNPSMALGGTAMFLLLYSNYSTLTGGLEFRVFPVSAVLSSIFICKRVKMIKKFKEDTAWGKKGSDDFVRLIFLSAFSLLIATFFVWSALTMNRILDRSQPTTMVAEIQTKGAESKFLLWTSYKISLRADIPNMRRWRYVVDQHLYSHVSPGDKVLLLIKGGAFGAPYIDEVKPYKAGRGREGQDGKS